jgi:hypothetical protein
LQKAVRGGRDFPDRGIEGALIRLRRLAVTAHLADVPESGSRNLSKGRWLGGSPEYFDAAAHGNADIILRVGFAIRAPLPSSLNETSGSAELYGRAA